MNAIVIMLDSLRPDHLGFYGNPWIKTPNLDRFAQEATIFERAYAEGMPTLPVRTALFTGRYTLMWRGWQHLEPEDVTLAETLRTRGYATALITDTAPMYWPRMAYERGFEYVRFIRGQLTDIYVVDPIQLDLSEWSEKNYLTEKDKEDFHQYLRNRHWWRDEEDHFVAQVMEEGVKWLREMKERGKSDGFLLWLDSFDPHEPWDPPERYYKLYEVKGYDGPAIINPSIYGDKGGFVDNFTQEEIEHIRAQYAGEVTFVDRWVGWFLEQVKELGLWEDTLIIILSDHGEPLGEHGIIRKVRPWPYEELSRIVLAIHHPKVIGRGGRVRAFVQTTDILSTILDFLGISEKPRLSRSELEVYPEVQGMSLRPLIEGEAEKVRDYAIAGHYGRSWSIRNEDYSFYLWSLEKAPYTFGYEIIEEQERQRPELYNIDRDYVPPMPEKWNKGDQPERENIVEGERKLAAELELALRRKLMFLEAR